MPRGKRKAPATNESIDVNGLKTYRERFERMAQALRDAQEDIKELKLELKSRGYDPAMFIKAMKVKEIGYEEYEIKDQEFHLYLQGVGAIPTREHEEVY